MATAFAQIAFTKDVRDQQARHGSAEAYGALLSDARQGGDRLTQREKEFIEARDGFYQATVSQTGWPYVQFRGGAPGFLSVLDDRTIAYADLSGNRQYLSLGNLTGNDRIALILMDYVHARRLKLWGRVTVSEAPAEVPVPLSAKVERLISIRVEAFDWNCPQHIPRRYTEGEAADEIARLERLNANLRAELRHMRAAVETK